MNKRYIYSAVWILILMSTSCLLADGVAVLMQESPAGAGTITPGLGVHSYCYDEQVTLNTQPKAGYRFVYWLGDVHEPTSSRTSMSIDGPKIIIAVFERDAYELESSATGVSSGPEKLTPNNRQSFNPVSSPAGAEQVFRKIFPSPVSFPDSNDPIITPIPEPATVAFMVMGISAIVAAGKKVKNSSQHPKCT